MLASEVKRNRKIIAERTEEKEKRRKDSLRGKITFRSHICLPREHRNFAKALLEEVDESNSFSPTYRDLWMLSSDCCDDNEILMETLFGGVGYTSFFIPTIDLEIPQPMMCDGATICVERRRNKIKNKSHPHNPIKNSTHRQAKCCQSKKVSSQLLRTEDPRWYGNSGNSDVRRVHVEVERKIRSVRPVGLTAQRQGRNFNYGRSGTKL